MKVFSFTRSSGPSGQSFHDQRPDLAQSGRNETSAPAGLRLGLGATLASVAIRSLDMGGEYRRKDRSTVAAFHDAGAGFAERARAVIAIELA